MASALASGHRLDPLAGLIMPGVVKIHWPRAQFSMRLDLGNVRINRPLGNPAELWAMPALSDTPTIDLSDPNLRLAPPVSPGTPTAGLLPRLLPLGRGGNWMPR